MATALYTMAERLKATETVAQQATRAAVDVRQRQLTEMAEMVKAAEPFAVKAMRAFGEITRQQAEEGQKIADMFAASASAQFGQVVASLQATTASIAAQIRLPLLDVAVIQRLAVESSGDVVEFGDLDDAQRVELTEAVTDSLWAVLALIAVCALVIGGAVGWTATQMPGSVTLTTAIVLADVLIHATKALLPPEE